jgi:hypothetical protein
MNDPINKKIVNNEVSASRPRFFIEIFLVDSGGLSSINLGSGGA